MISIFSNTTAVFANVAASAGLAHKTTGTVLTLTSAVSARASNETSPLTMYRVANCPVYSSSCPHPVY